MEITLKRFSPSPTDSLGLLSIDGHFQCFSLEDEPREVKVAGETRIPAGRYQITLRDFGGKHSKYVRKFPGMHRGMLWLRDVPNYKFVLIHIGNDENDTDACILVGDSASQNVTRKGFISQSRFAYERIYPLIAASIESGELVYITVEDES